MTFHKYLKIKHFGDEELNELLVNPEDDLVIQEKIDGANFRFMVVDGRIVFGSRTQSIGDSNQEIGGNWKRCVEFIKEKVNVDLVNGMFIFYGECCVKHSMSYDWDKIPPYLGFDIMNIDSGQFLPYPLVKDIFTELNLPFVPVIKECKVKDLGIITDDSVPKSAYSECQAEGIVIKNYSKQLFAKYVREKFKELNRETFGGAKKFAEDDSERIALAFCTNARIEKAIFKLLHEGNKLEMRLMEELPRMVTNDIYEEHWKEICFSSWSVNFKKVRKHINNRCSHVLHQMITNNALQEGVTA